MFLKFTRRRMTLEVKKRVVWASFNDYHNISQNWIAVKIDQVICIKVNRIIIHRILAENIQLKQLRYCSKSSMNYWLAIYSIQDVVADIASHEIFGTHPCRNM